MERCRSPPDYHVIRTYLEYILELPWKNASEEKLDLAEARRVLDEDHYGLEDIKERILESLAVVKLREREKPAEKPADSNAARLARAASSSSSALRESARPRWGVQSHVRSGVNSIGSRSAECVTRLNFAAIAGPTSERCPAASSNRCGVSASIIR